MDNNTACIAWISGVESVTSVHNIWVHHIFCGWKTLWGNLSMQVKHNFLSPATFEILSKHNLSYLFSIILLIISYALLNIRWLFVRKKCESANGKENWFPQIKAALSVHYLRTHVQFYLWLTELFPVCKCALFLSSLCWASRATSEFTR